MPTKAEPIIATLKPGSAPAEEIRDQITAVDSALGLEGIRPGGQGVIGYWNICARVPF